MTLEEIPTCLSSTEEREDFKMREENTCATVLPDVMPIPNRFRTVNLTELGKPAVASGSLEDESELFEGLGTRSKGKTVILKGDPRTWMPFSVTAILKTPKILILKVTLTIPSGSLRTVATANGETEPDDSKTLLLSTTAKDFPVESVNCI